jgi:hypothetical protein
VGQPNSNHALVARLITAAPPRAPRAPGKSH